MQEVKCILTHFKKHFLKNPLPCGVQQEQTSLSKLKWLRLFTTLIDVVLVILYECYLLYFNAVAMFESESDDGGLFA